jgi:UDPglucose 6-dehydrogenase
MARRPQAVVAGGAGFLGSHICERLLADGYGVVCIDNFSTGIPANVAHLAEQGPFRFISADISDRIRIDGDVDVVLNFASPASPPDYLNLPIQTLTAGSAGTLNTLELAREKKARYLLASTSEAYGDPLVHPQPETYWGNVNPIGPRSVYDEAKRFGEALTMAYRRHHGTDTAIMRIFNTHGPRMRPTDGRAVPNFIVQALRGAPITVTGDGSQTRSIMYVADLVEGCMRLIHRDSPGPVNIGNPDEITMGDLARLIRDLTGSASEIVYIQRPTDDPTVRRPDITLARELLGWEPAVSLEAGLLETIAWFRDAVPGESLPAASRPRTAAAPDSGKRVAVIGSGYVGLTTGACLAALGHRVVCADVDNDKVKRLTSGEVDIYEPGLRELVAEGLASGRLAFVLGAAAAVPGANMVFLCVPTPMLPDGAADLTIVEEVVAE